MRLLGVEHTQSIIKDIKDLLRLFSLIDPSNEVPTVEFLGPDFILGKTFYQVDFAAIIDKISEEGKVNFIKAFGPKLVKFPIPYVIGMYESSERLEKLKALDKKQIAKQLDEGVSSLSEILNLLDNENDKLQFLQFFDTVPSWTSGRRTRAVVDNYFGGLSTEQQLTYANTVVANITTLEQLGSFIVVMEALGIPLQELAAFMPTLQRLTPSFETFIQLLSSLTNDPAREVLVTIHQAQVNTWIDDETKLSKLLNQFDEKSRADVIDLLEPKTLRELLNLLGRLSHVDKQIQYLRSLNTNIQKVVTTYDDVKLFLSRTDQALHEMFAQNMGNKMHEVIPSLAKLDQLLREITGANGVGFKTKLSNKLLALMKVTTCIDLLDSEYLKKYADKFGHSRKQRVIDLISELQATKTLLLQASENDSITLLNQIKAKLYLQYTSIEDSHSKVSLTLEKCLFAMLDMNPESDEIKQAKKEQNGFVRRFNCFFNYGRGELAYARDKSTDSIYKLITDKVKMERPFKEDDSGKMLKYYKELETLDIEETRVFTSVK